MSTLRTIVLVLFGFAVVPALVMACSGDEPVETGDTMETDAETDTM